MTEVFGERENAVNLEKRKWMKEEINEKVTHGLGIEHRSWNLGEI